MTEADAADARVAASIRDVDRLAARISLLETRLADTVIHAPFDGTIVQRDVEPGEWIEPGTPLMTLVSSGDLEAWLEVPERYAAALASHSSRVEMEIGTQRVSSDRLRVVPMVDRRARTLPLVVRVQSEGAFLAPGMSVTAWIQTGDRRTVLTVPRDALVRTGEGNFVFRLDRSAPARAIARRVPVELEFSRGDRIAVRGSLSEGDEIVTEGNARLAPGQHVRAVSSPARAARRASQS